MATGNPTRRRISHTYGTLHASPAPNSMSSSNGIRYKETGKNGALMKIQGSDAGDESHVIPPPPGQARGRSWQTSCVSSQASVVRLAPVQYGSGLPRRLYRLSIGP